MAIGFLQLDPDYIKREYVSVKKRWSDEPKNSAVAFQFDPTDVKLIVPTKWKDDKPEAVSDLKIGMKYDRETTENQDRIELKLTFSDVVLNHGTISHDQLALTTRKPGELPEGVPNTQRSLEILEAMALPVQDMDVQTIESVYFRDVAQFVVTPDGTRINTRELDAVQSLTSWDNTFDKYATYGSSRHGRPTTVPDPRTLEKTTVEGKRLVAAWHPPRPLLLHLVTPTPFNCVLQKLEFEILTLDGTTGAPIVATAKVTLVNFNLELFKDGYDGLVQPKPINLGERNEHNQEALSLEDWNHKISMGGAILNQTLRKKEFIYTSYRASKQQTGATMETHNNARDKAILARTTDLRRIPSLTNQQ